MPFKLGVPELIIILLIILVIFGAAKLPQIGGALGKSIREFRKEASNKDEKTEEQRLRHLKTPVNPKPPL